ncbi:hypothetical protein B4168_3453 [Anoxybacillus flavithermus]|nr:hypothetical protein B4168_3453 [Anoxybacillus flavithermus]OAO84553.1 hypothetical protein GT23_3404 [Parageobacillus thermoglucosidasius]
MECFVFFRQLIAFFDIQLLCSKRELLHHYMSIVSKTEYFMIIWQYIAI